MMWLIWHWCLAVSAVARHHSYLCQPAICASDYGWRALRCCGHHMRYECQAHKRGMLGLRLAAFVGYSLSAVVLATASVWISQEGLPKAPRGGATLAMLQSSPSIAAHCHTVTI